MCVILLPMSNWRGNPSGAEVMASLRRVAGGTVVQHVNADRLVDPELPGVLYHLVFFFEPVRPLPD